MSYKCIVVLVLVCVPIWGVQLFATPSVFSTKETITVTWEGVSNPTSLDSIAVYLSNYSYSVDRKRVNLTETWHLGYGNLTFDLVNMRQNYFFSYNSFKFGIVGVSDEVEVDANMPMHGHLATTDYLDQMIVSWTSNSSLPSTVRYGYSSYLLEFVATGNWTTYTVADFPKSNYTLAIDKFYPPGMVSTFIIISDTQLHKVILDNLLPDSVYFYQYGSDEGWSDVHAFRSRRNESRIPFNGIFFGDLGVSSLSAGVAGTLQVLQEDLNNEGYDTLLHIGDISYAKGNPIIWEKFFAAVEPIATSVPYMVAIGNHEYDYPEQPFKPSWMNYGIDSGGECGIPYLKRFSMPNNGLWYSIDYPLVHIVVMSSEHNFTIGSPQYKWLEQDLHSVDHTKKWIVFASHRPIYSSTTYSASELQVDQSMKIHLEPLLLKYEVDLALFGHMHNYERSCPVRDGICVGNYSAPGGTVHVVVGSAGANLFNTKQHNAWSQYWKNTFGYIRLRIPDRKSMTIEFQQTNQQMGVIDSFTINQVNWTEAGIVEALPTVSPKRSNLYKIYIAVAVCMFVATTLMVFYKLRKITQNRAIL